MASGGELEEVVVSMSKASLEVKEEEKGKKIDRHCAFCLTLIPGGKVKTCSKCKRRAYCSKDCQTLDWKVPKNNHIHLKKDGDFRGYVQEHRNWCGLNVCEEDLDWKVVQIEGKGQGVVALRDIPPLTRIMVEGRYEVRVCDPTEAEERARAEGNRFTGGLRIQRVNHDCRNNASLADDEANVYILYSNSLILAGEEICTSYIVGNLMCGMASKHLGFSYKTPAECRDTLFQKHGIICPLSCICRDEKRLLLQREVMELTNHCEERFRTEQVDEKFEKAIENGKALGVSALTLAMLYSMVGKYAAKGPEKKEEKGKEFVGMSYEIRRAVHHPKSNEKWEQIGRKFYSNE